MAKNDRILVWVLVVIAILLVHSMGYFTIPGLQQIAGDENKQVDDSATGTLCLHDGATMTVGPVQRRYKPTESVVDSDGDYHRVIIDGVDRGLKADGSTMKVVTPTRVGGTDGSAVEIYYAENSSNYYAAKQAFTVPCVSAFSSGARPDSDAYKLVANASSDSVTITVFNDDDSLKNSDENNESIGADDAADLDVKINWPAKRGFSPQGDIIFTIEFNDSAYDQDNIDLTESSGAPVTVTTTPQFRSSANQTSKWAMKSWRTPGYESLTTKVQHFNLHLDSSSLDPTSTNSAGNVNIYLDDEDWYRNSETGLMEFGPEDNEQNDVGYTGDLEYQIKIE